MTIKFYKTNEPYGFFNNFKKAPFLIYDRWWKNVEAAYQAQKTFIQDEYDAIWKAETPREARDLGQKVTMRPDWDQVKYGVMLECVQAKFEQHKDLRDLLLSTGDEEIVEDSPIDSYWGCGADGKGQNNLGKILMEVRSRLRK
jgi:ribA/ribD-fused uncharacterized protein